MADRQPSTPATVEALDTVGGLGMQCLAIAELGKRTIMMSSSLMENYLDEKMSERSLYNYHIQLAAMHTEVLFATIATDPKEYARG